MNYVQVIKDSIDTSITMKLFTNRKRHLLLIFLSLN